MQNGIDRLKPMHNFLFPKVYQQKKETKKEKGLYHTRLMFQLLKLREILLIPTKKDKISTNSLLNNYEV